MQGLRTTAQGLQVKTLPTLLIALRGPDRIAIDVRAQTAANGAGQLVADFPSLPDAFLQTFTLQISGGPGGILVITGRGTTICAKPQIAAANLDAQSGKTETLNPTISTPACQAARKKTKRHKKHKKHK